MKRRSTKFLVIYFSCIIIAFIPAIIRITEHYIIEHKIKIGIEQYAKEYCNQNVRVESVFLEWVHFNMFYGGARELVWKVFTKPELTIEDHRDHRDYGLYDGKIVFLGLKCSEKIRFIFDESAHKFIPFEGQFIIDPTYEPPSIFLFLLGLIFYPLLALYGIIVWYFLRKNEKRINKIEE